MSVIKYKIGEHGSGFVGYRVARTIGDNADYRQKYFSFKYYGEDAAKKLAYSLDKRWQSEAIKVRRYKELLYGLRLNDDERRPHVIAKGLRGSILVERKYREGRMKTYFAPGFHAAPRGHGRSERFFRIGKWGFKGAYIKAVAFYAKARQLNAADTLALVARQPEKTLFTEYLLPQCQDRGHDLSKQHLAEVLNKEL